MDGGKAEARCICGKVCKNMRGLKIHQARSRCSIVLTQAQRTESTGETQEDPRQDTTHRARNLCVSESSQGSNGDLIDGLSLRESESQQKENARKKKMRISWPKGEEEVVWSSFDQDVSMILETTMQGNVERKIETLTNMVYNIGKEQFGTKKGKARKEQKDQISNRRERMIRECRQEIRELDKAFKKAREWEKAGIAQLTDDIRAELSRLRRAEQLRQRKKKREKNRSRFVKNPFNFTKELLGEERSETLHCAKKKVEKYLHETHSDPLRDEPLGQCPNKVEVDTPEALMNLKEPTWKKVNEVVRKARSCQLLDQMEYHTWYTRGAQWYLGSYGSYCA